MERVLKSAYARKHPTAVLISPSGTGWQLSRPNGESAPGEQFDSLKAVASVLGTAADFVLALPSSDVLMERMTLPSKDREELDGMVRLQLEKTLPFPPEEITCSYDVIRESENDSVVVAAAVHTSELEARVAPLREERELPSRVSMFASHIAAVCPEGVVLAVYREQERLMVLISENQKPAFLHGMVAPDPAGMEFELVHVLFSAEMEGIPTAFDAVRIDRSCAEFGAVIEKTAKVLAEPLPMEELPLDAGSDLLPQVWRQEVRRLERVRHFRQRIIAAAALYFVLILLAVGYVVLLRHRVSRLESRLVKERPRLEELQAQQARWNALAPAVDPARFAVEVLYQTLQSLPESVTINQFEYGPGQFLVVGEAGSAAAAIQFAEKLRKNPGLEAFKIESGPPTLVGGDRAQFRIFGKL